MLAASNLPSQRRRLDFVDRFEDENDSFEPMKWSPTSSLDVTVDYHDIINSKKSVRFHDPIIYSVATLDELTDEENEYIWYSREEYSALQSALRSAVKLFRKSNWAVTSKGQSRRGLEKYQLHNQRKHMERHHFDLVLSEQQRQREIGIFDAELLRQASLINSSWALQNAQRSAMYDALSCQQEQQRHQRNCFFSPQLYQGDSRSALSSCDEDDDEECYSYHRIEPEIESFPRMPSFEAATRLPTPPPSQPKRPSHQSSTGRAATSTVVALA